MSSACNFSCQRNLSQVFLKRRGEQEGEKKITCAKKRRPSALVLIYKKTLKLNSATGTVHGANFVSFCFSYANDRLPRTMYDRVIAV